MESVVVNRGGPKNIAEVRLPIPGGGVILVSTYKRQCDALKTIASAECPSPNARHAVRNFNRGQAGATVERRIANARHAVGNFK